MQAIVASFERNVIKLDGKVEAVERKIENNHVELGRIVGEIEKSSKGSGKRVIDKVEALKSHLDETNDEVKNSAQNWRS